MEPARKPLHDADDDLQALRIDRSAPNSQPRKKRAGPFILAALIVVVSAALFAFLRRPAGGSFGISATEVQVATATRRAPGGAQPILTAGGYVIARDQVEVGSKITGRVIVLEVREGYMVAKGQVIARLDDYEVKAQVNQAQANLAAAKARLAELEAGSRPQEIDRARADMDRAKADLDNAELTLRRNEQLLKQGVVQQQAADDARARFEMAAKAFQSAKESYELARIGPRREQIDLARAQLKQAEAELAYAQAQFENTIIRAPISGTILDRYVDLGEMVTTGFTSNRGAKQALVAIADLKDLQVELDISEADIAKVKLRQPAVIIPDAYSDRRYKGTVEYISSVADRQKATIKVKVKVLDPDEYLRPDMGTKVTFFEIGTAVTGDVGSVVVPKPAIVRQENNTIIFVVRDSKAAIQSVTLGKEEAGYVEIVSGLQGGESVVTSGQTSLKDGDPVTVRR